jgi:hypothetical protein
MSFLFRRWLMTRSFYRVKRLRRGFVVWLYAAALGMVIATIS